jgi:hypothetical protein
MDDIARIDQANAGDAVKRRSNRGVAQLGLGIFDGRLVGLDDLLVLGDEGALGIGLLLRRGMLLRESGVALEIELRIGEMGLVAGQRRLRLIELCLEGAWIDLRENLPALYLLSLGEVDLLERTRDLRADRCRDQVASATALSRRLGSQHVGPCPGRSPPASSAKPLKYVRACNG